ncbi:hypothetical protein WA577_006748 [Blastocystis sp. JDR]
MDGDDDLLKNFFAEIDKLPTPSAETPAEKKEDDIVKTTGFVECSDPIVSEAKLVAPKKPKVETAYIPPVFAEVDPEEKKKERLNKFYDNEVANLKKSRVFKRRENGETWEDATYPVPTTLTEVTTEILSNLFRQRYPSFTMCRVVENKLGKGSKGYGFVAFSDPLEGIKAMKEMNGKLCGSRPMKIQKSDWEKKNVKEIS